jgi:uncharacterized protein (AIM24 family)
VQRIELNNERMVVDGNYVLARTGEIVYTAQRAAKSLFSSFTSGEGLVRIFEGTGSLLMAPIPYWRQRLFGTVTGMNLRSSVRAAD